MGIITPTHRNYCTDTLGILYSQTGHYYPNTLSIIILPLHITWAFTNLVSGVRYGRFPHIVYNNYTMMALSPNLACNNQMYHIKLTVTLIFLLVVGTKVRIKEARKATHRTPERTVIREADSLPDTHQILSSLRDFKVHCSVQMYALLYRKSHG